MGTVAKKRIDITVFDGGFVSGGQYYAKARDEMGREVASAYGRHRRDAIAWCVEKVRRLYPDAETSY